ncbi:hypothetical protein Tco_0555351 [Tanacetum coccineum]
MNYADIDYREESETKEESGESKEESSNEDKGIEDDSEDKMYINENKKIRTRNPPKSLANIMSKLTDAQIESLKDMGFGSFVGIKINRFPTTLARWLFLNYDPRTSVLQVEDVKIKLTSQTVHDIFGLPMGGKEIVELNQSKKTDEVIEEWMGTDIKKLDWCGYLLKCLKRTKTLWNGGLFNGPSTILTKEMIASNKKIIAPDTDIKTHEIIVAKTTPEKEKMTKSKIIATKNAVSQSFIKVVNLGDISGKASNGISNTPKDAHVTTSGLRNKLTMLEVLMNGIACDLEKAIQQHPGDKEIENMKLQWKEMLLKRSSEMNKKDKERPNVKFLELVEVVSTTVKEPSTVLLLNDAPSFDLGLTPTPPDVNLDRDTAEYIETMLENDVPNADITLVTYAIERKRKDLPMLENEHVKKNAKESGPTNTRIAFDVVPLSFAMSNATLVTDEHQKHVEVILSISHWIK